MADFIDTIKLIADADLSKAAGKIREFSSSTTGQLSKVQGNAGTSGTQAGTAFSEQFQKTALAGFAAVTSAAATLGGIRFLESTVKDAVELARAEASLSSQVKDVGAQAGVTTGSLDRLATTVQNQQAIFAGTVKGGESLLLTFHEIRNEAGAGNDIFNRTIKVAGGLANVFGTDLNPQVVQLGRALENPLTGILALQRAKIALPESLKEQVKTLAQQGDLLGAQRVLLDELESRYVSAGAAIAKADPFQQFSVSLKQFKTDVGKDFLPIATELLDFAGAALESFDKLPAPIKDAAEALAAVGFAAAPLLALRAGLVGLRSLGGALGQPSPDIDTSSATATDARSAASTKAAEAEGELAQATAAEAQESTAASAAMAELVASANAASVAFEQESAWIGAVDEQLSLFQAAVGQAAASEEAAAAASEAASDARVERAFRTVAPYQAAIAAEIAANEALIASQAATEQLSFLGTGTSAGQQQVSTRENLTRVTAAQIESEARLAAVAEATREEYLASDAAMQTHIASVAQLTAGQSALFNSHVALLGATQASVSTEGEQLAIFEVEGPAVESLAAQYQRLAAEKAASAAVPAAGGVGLAGAASGAAIGAIAGIVALGVINHLTDPSHEKFEELTKDVDRLSSSVERFSRHDNIFQKVFHLGSEKEAIADIKELNQGFTDILDAQGPQKAQKAFDDFLKSLQTKGASSEVITDLQIQLGPFTRALLEAQRAEAAAAKNTSDLSVAFQALSQQLDKQSALLTIADDFDAVRLAQDKVKDDWNDIAGTSDKAKQANDDVASALRGVVSANEHVTDSHLALTDSYQKLKDAQDKVAESTKTLKNAQADLDAFNSPRGAEERALKLDILKRRVVTTPGEFDQKQLDLLQNADENAKKQADLTDAVSRAQKGLRDALRGVADAQHGIATAERGVRDATQAVADANDKVRDAVAKRRKLHDDAAKAIEGDERKVEEALLKTYNAIADIASKTGESNAEITLYGTLLKDLGDSVGGPIKKAFDTFYDDIILKQKAFNEATAKGKPGGTPNGPRPTKPGPHDPQNVTGNSPSDAFSGGYVPHAADGAIFSASEGVKYKFNEPEAGGEALIPLGGSKRGRATGILSTVAEMFGLQLAEKGGRARGYADGGLPGAPRYSRAGAPEREQATGESSSAWGGGVAISQTNHFSSGTTLADLDFANRELGWRLSRMGR